MNGTAQTAALKQSTAEDEQYLTFVLGRETMAITIAPVREIIEYAAPTDVPMMPGSVRGVINLRGMVVPVVDLAVRLGRTAGSVTRKTCIVVVETGDAEAPQTFGIVVDAVNAVIDIAAAEIEPPPPFGAALRTDFIAGLGKVNGQFIVILDTAKILAMDDALTAMQSGKVLATGTALVNAGGVAAVESMTAADSAA